MNNRHRDEMDELTLAEQTARVLESGDCGDRDDAATYELGRLLRQSANHELPESNEELREQLLMTLAADGDAPMVATKEPLEKASDRVSRNRLWMGLAAGALVAVGGWWLYQPRHGFGVDVKGGMNTVGQLDMKEFPRVAVETSESSKESRTERNGRLGDDFGAAMGTAYEGKSDLLRDHDAKKDAEAGMTYRGMVDKMASALRSANENASDKSIEAFGIRGESEQKIATVTDTLGQQTKLLAQTEQDQGGDRGLPVKMSVTPRIIIQDESETEPALSKRFTGEIESLDSTSVATSEKGFANSKSETNTRFYSDLSVPLAKNGSINTGGAYNSDNGRPLALGFAMDLPDKLQTTSTNSGVSVPDGGTILMGGVSGFRAGRDGEDGYRENESKLGLGESLRFEEGFGREQYAAIHENAFVQANGGAAISTFSIDVDTASYANMRRFLNAGQTPPRDSIRIEELVNYFQYDYPQPKGDDPFSVNMELASCPWNDAHKLLRVGLKGKEIHVQERPATNLVYLIDVSGSMNSADKLPLLKRGFQMMTKQLGENDRVSIVTYAGNAGVALEPTTGDKTKTINEAIERLASGGSTHGSAGIELAYKLAQQHFISGGVNKVILATDGDLNVGVTADGALVKLIKQKASEGVFLTVLGFGTGNLQDGKLEKLADNGNGHYAYIDSNREAHRVLVQQMSGSLVTIAKDVKIQIEFNPAEVKSYRLVGYENRMLATKDFDDDRKDAGEIGAGHTVTAIYEIEPTGGVEAAFVAPQGMKYQVANAEAPQKVDGNLPGLSKAAASGELATLALRYKKPDENTSKRIEFTVKNDEKSFSSASDDFRFAASVAGFGMLLRGSEHAGNANPGMILEMASESMGDDTTGYRAEFIDLVRKAFSGQ